MNITKTAVEVRVRIPTLSWGVRSSTAANHRLKKSDSIGSAVTRVDLLPPVNSQGK
jgi:hypothetical protein